jgi:chromosome transmission fidelity protein 18
VDLYTISLLCEMVEYDIRSALNTLQFLKIKTPYVTPQLLATSAVGHKDTTKNLFQVWKDIFQTSSSERKKSLNQKLHQHADSNIALMGMHVTSCHLSCVN